MTRRLVAVGGLAVAAVALAAAAVHPSHGGVTAFPDAPPPARTGGFGEQTCRACHFDNPLNEPGGTLTITGVPSAWEAGRTYHLIVAVRGGELLAGGFQLAARFADGGAQAGALRPVDERTQVASGPLTAIQYASHARPGTEPTDAGHAVWIIEWTAPPGAGRSVVFHASALSANGDGSALGDRVYTTSVTAPPARR